MTDFSHAGGVVVRRQGGTIQYLLVQARNAPGEWVLPKGHVEPGESLEEAARREVLEETGIHAAIRGALDTVEYSTPDGPVKAKFFLMEALDEGPPGEGRAREWLPITEAIRKLEFEESKNLVGQADAFLNAD